MKLFKGVDDNQFFLTIWSMIITGIVIIAFIIADTAQNEDMIIKDLVNKGHDPMEVACLYKMSDYIQAACIIKAQNKGQKNDTKP